MDGLGPILLRIEQRQERIEQSLQRIERQQAVLLQALAEDEGDPSDVLISLDGIEHGQARDTGQSL